MRNWDIEHTLVAIFGQIVVATIVCVFAFVPNCTHQYRLDMTKFYSECLQKATAAECKLLASEPQ